MKKQIVIFEVIDSIVSSFKLVSKSLRFSLEAKFATKISINCVASNLTDANMSKKWVVILL
mgnify:CR=1 FL=1